jgi:hypothetical protein
MKKAIEKKLKENKVLWAAWSKYGVNETTALTPDFTFYCTDLKTADRLKTELERLGYSPKLTPKRTLIIFKGYEVQISIKESHWSSDKLNKYSEQFIELAGKCDCNFETIGASIPNNL